MQAEVCQPISCHNYASLHVGPYDAIHVGAAAPTIPEALVEQLASPGRMFIPVGTHTQHIYHVDKDEHGKVTKKEIMGVSVSGTILLNLSPLRKPAISMFPLQIWRHKETPHFNV